MGEFSKELFCTECRTNWQGPGGWSKTDDQLRAAEIFQAKDNYDGDMSALIGNEREHRK